MGTLIPVPRLGLLLLLVLIVQAWFILAFLNMFAIVYFKCLDIFSETHFTDFSFGYFYFFEYIIIIFLNRARKLVQSAIL